MADKAELEASPLQWVERLLEPLADESMMTQAAQVLSQSHYTDVVEERNISNLCGYPLCVNPLGEQPKQKYHISLAQKKVFDLTERKKFCSVECYRASKYYASQLSTLPFAARTMTSVAIQLLPCKKRTTEQEPGDVKCRSITTKTSTTAQGATSKMEELELEDVDNTPHRTFLDPPKLSSVGHLLHAMSSWCTPDTWQLVTSMRQDSCTREEGTSAYENVTTAGCLPDSITTDLKRDSTRNEPGRDCEEDNVPLEYRTGREGMTEDGDGEGASLPPVHSSAQSQLQMSIFLQQLKRNFQSVGTRLSLSLHEVLPDMMPLVRTFSFTRHTVTFKPAEWKMIIFILLHTVYPDWDLKTAHSTVIQEWMKGVNATDNDVMLMLNTFLSSS